MSNMINSIVKSNLKANKLKNIMVILTIALTTCLLISIGIITSNMIENQKQLTIKNYGNSHGYYRKLEQETVDKIKRHKDIEILGENSFQLGKNEIDDRGISIAYIDENGLELSNMKLIDGKAPIKHNEIAMDETILSVLGYEAKIGEKINISYHDTKGDFVEKEFILSGILPKNITGEANKLHSMVVSKELIEKEGYNNKLRATVRLKNEDKLSQDEIREKITEIGKTFGVDEENIKFNDAYLMWMKPDTTFILTGVVIALVVIASSILVIYNIFYISIVNKIQEFGKLKAIGTTKKQIRNIVFREGMILTLISIPIGVILGYFVSKSLINTMINLGNEMGIEYEFIVNINIIIVCILLTFLTVYISLLKPMKIVSKISPVEAIKYNENSNSKKKNRKGYIDLDVIRLTKANLSRNKKRTTTTLLSLVLSGILIMSTSTVISCINYEKMVRQSMPGDFEFKIKYMGFDYEKEKENFIKNNPLNKEFIQNIKSLDGVKNVNEIREVSVFTQNQGRYKKEEPDLKEIEDSIGVYSDEMIKSLDENILSGKINIDKLKSGEEIIINSAAEYWLELEVGDVVKLYYYEGNKKIEKEVKVQAVTSAHYGGGFITSIDFIKDSKYNTSISVNVDKNKEREINKVLTDISFNYNNLEYSSFKDEVETNEKMFFTTNSMGYSLVGVIGAISLVNLINTIITSMISRKREIGILQAIGMSDKQLLKMLKLEGLFYTSITLISSLSVGSIIGYIAYKVMQNTGMHYAVYKFPIIPTTLLAITMILVQLFIGRFINKLFKKESLIDRVRYSE